MDSWDALVATLSTCSRCGTVDHRAPVCLSGEVYPETEVPEEGAMVGWIVLGVGVVLLGALVARVSWSQRRHPLTHTMTEEWLDWDRKTDGGAPAGAASADSAVRS